MRLILVSYATPRFEPGQKRLRRSAARVGIDRVVSMGPRDLEGTEFWTKNRALLEERRGAGYWLWKPFIIREALRSATRDDVVAYSDAGIEIVAPLDPLTDLIGEGRDHLIFTNHGRISREWTKRDCFVLMGCDSEEYHESEQLDAAFMLMRGGRSSMDLVEEWLGWCEVPEVITDAPNTCGLPDLEGFKAHRHDQSVLTLLSVKHGLERFRDPTYIGNHLKFPEFRVPGERLRHPYTDAPMTNSRYGTLLNHDRAKARRVPLRRRVRKRLWFIAKRLGLR